jgi:hypothetical protein
VNDTVALLADYGDGHWNCQTVRKWFMNHASPALPPWIDRFNQMEASIKRIETKVDTACVYPASASPSTGLQDPILVGGRWYAPFPPRLVPRDSDLHPSDLIEDWLPGDRDLIPMPPILVPRDPPARPNYFAGQRSLTSSPLRPQITEANPQQDARPNILSATADLVVGANLSLRFVQSDPWKAFLGTLWPRVPPAIWEVRAEIMRKADELRNALTPESQGGHFATLMIDGTSLASGLGLESVSGRSRESAFCGCFHCQTKPL